MTTSIVMGHEVDIDKISNHKIKNAILQVMRTTSGCWFKDDHTDHRDDGPRHNDNHTDHKEYKESGCCSYGG